MFKSICLPNPGFVVDLCERGLGIHQRGVQSEGGAVDWASII